MRTFLVLGGEVQLVTPPAKERMASTATLSSIVSASPLAVTFFGGEDRFGEWRHIFCSWEYRERRRRFFEVPPGDSWLGRAAGGELGETLAMHRFSWNQETDKWGGGGGANDLGVHGGDEYSGDDPVSRMVRWV